MVLACHLLRLSNCTSCHLQVASGQLRTSVVIPSNNPVRLFLLLNNEDVAYVLVVLDRAMASPRSSISSDHQLFTGRSRNLPTAPATPGRDLEGDRPGLSTGGGSTDPATIHAITQTMIGEFLYKYTRRTIGKGHGQTRHKRFFWVHPYTKTLYWSNADPGSSNVHESSAKSGEEISIMV